MEMETTAQSTPLVTEPTQQEVPQIVENKSKKKLVMVVSLISLLFISGGYYVYQRYMKSHYPVLTEKSATTPVTPEKKENLNPNSGNLYKDIKIRMKEVLQ